jgi:parallel beta-helix repeat protein
LIISRTISLIGEDAETTTLSLHPQWVTQVFITTPLSYYAAPIKIEASNVKISSLTINSDGGEISANGDRTQMSKNILSVSVSLQGSNQSFTENTLIGASVTCRGAYASISKNNVLNGIIGSDSGSYDMIFANTVVGTIAVGGTSENELVYGNIVRDGSDLNRAGISVASRGTIVANNTISNCSRGISIDWGSNNIASGNIITNNRGPALVMTRGNNFTFFGNYVANNLVGVEIDTYTFALYHNNFINNDLQIEPLGDKIHFWFMDNGKEGNYWSDYDGRDNNGDGIGDARYFVKNEIADRFPLFSLFDISRVNVPLSQASDIYKAALGMLESEPAQTSPQTGESVNEDTSSLFPSALVVATSVAVVAVVGAGLLVYFKKHRR